jgi:xanthine dehydrogenase YagR molybdenum-binding subunit
LTTAYIGRQRSRVDGPAKVTGAAKYAAECRVPGLVHGYVVTSLIARGHIVRIESAEALGIPGVLDILTHENTSHLPSPDPNYAEEVGPPGSTFRPLLDNEIKFSAQPVALVVAESFELARFAASLVRIEYERKEHVTDLESARAQAYVPKPWNVLPRVPRQRGDAAQAFSNTAVRVDAEYRAQIQHHNPMELFATTVVREDDGRLTVHDKTQGVQNVQGYLCSNFGYSPNNVRVLSPFVGGAFGLGLRPQYQVFLAVLAAHVLRRSVRVSLTRQQMFGLGYRPGTWQRVALGAATDGTLAALIHEAVGVTSRFEDYTEKTLQSSGTLYQCDNVTVDYKLVQLDLCTPIDMRAPGSATGVCALECAMDELASRLRIDPLELRLKNYAENDQARGVPFSSKALRECYQQGAEAFGWARRTPEPRSMREGDVLIGWGMASGMYDALHVPASARCVLTVDGKLTVSSATADIGTGTYTIMTQIAAELMGLLMEEVTFELGDSSLPIAPVEGDSFTAASVGTAVKAACDNAREQLLTLARNVDRSPLADATLDDVVFADGQIRSRSDGSRTVSLRDAMRGGKVDAVRAEASGAPSPEQQRHACFSHSAVFAEVRVDEELGMIQVARIVSAVASGRILNRTTARSQIMGGVVWGIGQALEEESVIDQTFGRFINHSLGEYHVPVNADVHDIDVIFVEEQDEIVNPLGAKGLGEIGVVGVAAAIANAVFHATGRRVRDFPITLDKVM